jgi:GxxExxY protein
VKDREELDRIAKILVDSAYSVHRELGPGLLESSYQACLAYELIKRNLDVKCELKVPLRYDGVVLDPGYRLDMLIEEEIVVENKAVATLLPVHRAQVITYLKLSGHRLGFLINWNVALIKQGIKRIVLGF